MSGLSIAAHLAQTLPHDQHVLLMDSRQVYQRDKSWCHWHLKDGLMDPAISHRWHRWTVEFQGETCTHTHPVHPYVHVDSGRYYETAWELVSRHPGFASVLGEQIRELKPVNDLVQIIGKQQIRTAKYVVDSRPQRGAGKMLLQHFQGWEIRCEHAVFDPSTVTLMDFQVAGEGDIHFFYVLPFSARHALVESTHFSPTVLPRQVYAAELKQYINKLGCGAYEIERCEGGVIPMTTQPLGEHIAVDRIARVGVTTAATKPSTGYCYAATQHQARCLAQHACPVDLQKWRYQRSALARWMDAVFLGFLSQHPHRAPEIFMRFFRNNDAGTVIRFLSDRAKPSDYAAVAQSLPMLPFARQAVRHALYG